MERREMNINPTEPTNVSAILGLWAQKIQ